MAAAGGPILAPDASALSAHVPLTRALPPAQTSSGDGVADAVPVADCVGDADADGCCEPVAGCDCERDREAVFVATCDSDGDRLLDLLPVAVTLWEVRAGTLAELPCDTVADSDAVALGEAACEALADAELDELADPLWLDVGVSESDRVRVRDCVCEPVFVPERLGVAVADLVQVAVMERLRERVAL